MRVFIFSILLLLLSSCSRENYTIKNINGVRVVNNKNIPNAPDMELKLHKLYEIETPEFYIAYNNIREYIKFDSEGSLYLMNAKERKVYKYDNKGKYITTFCNKGQGPGEIIFTNGIYIENDTIVVFDTARKVYNYFNTAGEFLNTGKEKIKGIINYKNLGDNTLYSGYGYKKSNGLYEVNWGLYNINFSRIDTIYNYKCIFEKGYNEPAMTIKYDTYKDRFCFLNPDPQKFKIEVYDISSNKVSEINMYHRHIKDSDKQIRWIREYNKNSGRKLEAVGKLPVTNVDYDKYGNIWAERFFDYSQNPEYENKTVYDVFSPDGIYLNRIIDKNDYDEPFVSDKYIKYDDDEGVITVYDYEITGVNL